MRRTLLGVGLVGFAAIGAAAIIFTHQVAPQFLIGVLPGVLLAEGYILYQLTGDRPRKREIGRRKKLVAAFINRFKGLDKFRIPERLLSQMAELPEAHVNTFQQISEALKERDAFIQNLKARRLVRKISTEIGGD